MVSKENVKGLIAVFVGMLIFKSTTNIDYIEYLISNHPYIIIGLSLVAFFYRSKIADYLGAK